MSQTPRFQEILRRLAIINEGFVEDQAGLGGEVLRGSTPRIDSLADQGLKLLNFNVEAQCTPSRPWRLGRGRRRRLVSR
jgi:hypothetical protein